MVGELSQYAQRKITPDTEMYVMFSNPLTIRPKVIFVSCADDSDAATNQAYFFDGVLKLFGTGGGQMVYKNANDLNTTGGFFVQDDVTSNARVGMYNGDIRINRVSGSAKWSTTTEYTFDIYG